MHSMTAKATSAMPLLAGADMAGGEWPEKVRKALVSVFGKRAKTDEQEYPLLLLADIRDIFDDNPQAEALTTKRIIDELKGITGHPWAEYGKGRDGITPRALATLLHRFGIQSQQFRVDNDRGEKKTLMCYLRVAFGPTWDAYLDAPSTPDSPLSETPATPAPLQSQQSSDQATVQKSGVPPATRS